MFKPPLRLSQHLLSVLTSLLALYGLMAPDVRALTVQVNDQHGRPVDNAVVTVQSQSTANSAQYVRQTHILDQMNKQFVPELIAIRRGDSVDFPNSDNIRHHVYSFSEPKIFDLPLYAGESADVVEFDKPGKVVVGCNIHDRMRGYIYIIESPVFAVTKKGIVTFGKFADDNVLIEVYHPMAEIDPVASIATTLSKNEDSIVELTINISSERVSSETGDLTELEKKFRALRRGKD